MTAEARPFVLLHGLGHQCRNSRMRDITEYLTAQSGQQGYCIEIGNGRLDSWFMSINKQVRSLCQTLKRLPLLYTSGGYNLVGFSQGALIGRAVIQTCEDAPRVHNFVSVGGPQAGTASIPYCGSRRWCRIGEELIEPVVYTSLAQKLIAPAGFIKIPHNLRAYTKASKFLPRINNEIQHGFNSVYKERLSSLNRLVLVMFMKDRVIIPAESAWFGYYQDNSKDLKTVLPAHQTKLYKDDLIGLRSLDEAGKVTWLSLPRGHLHINNTDMDTHILPYLID